MSERNAPTTALATELVCEPRRRVVALRCSACATRVGTAMIAQCLTAPTTARTTASATTARASATTNGRGRTAHIGKILVRTTAAAHSMVTAHVSLASVCASPSTTAFRVRAGCMDPVGPWRTHATTTVPTLVCASTRHGATKPYPRTASAQPIPLDRHAKHIA